ncbi:hypothetical protein [Kordiimonas sp.]|uniref:hypothetical protein n=1 Tax=Kordiimonas sp. TaxID=1970157 RepID=UPI003A94F6ED
MADSETPLLVLDKNASEELWFINCSFHEHELMDMRVRKKETGRKTKKGLTLRMETIPAFIQALSEAYKKATAKAPSKGGA